MSIKKIFKKPDVDNRLKKLYLHYTIKQNKITHKCKVYRHFLNEPYSPTAKEVTKKQLVKKNLSPRDAENLIYLLKVKS